MSHTGKHTTAATVWRADGTFAAPAIADITGLQAALDGKAASTTKLDDLAAPDDNTDLDASTSTHGLMKKYPGGSTNFLREDGTFAAPAAGDLDSVLTASSTIAANKVRTIGGRLTISDGGGRLTIADTGRLVLV